MKRMKPKPKIAVGMEISTTSVALAVVRQDEDGLHLVRAARKPIDPGVWENPDSLKRLIKDLRRVCKVKRVPVTLSLLSHPSLMQIVEVPSNLSGHIGQYLTKEIKNYVSLSGVTVVSDYQDINAINGVDRVFVVAADSEQVTEVVNFCQQGGVDIEVVEPQLLATIRALYHQRIAGRFGCNILLAIPQDDSLTLAVIRERAIDFVRTQPLEYNPDEPEAMLEQLVAKIKVIMQYYDIEVEGSTGNWEVNVIAANEMSLPTQTECFLGEHLEQIPCAILTSDNIVASLSVDIPPDISADQVSMVAMGHAMRDLSGDILLPKINCLPHLIREIKGIQRSMLLTVISAATVLLIMGLLTLVLIQRGDYVTTKNSTRKPVNSMQEVVEKRGAIEAEILSVGEIPKRLKEVLETQNKVNWARLLTDVRAKIPKNVSISRFDTRNNTVVFIDGIALNSNDITRFLTRLNQSDHIASVELVKTDYDSDNKYHSYGIKCQLMTKQKG
jgi:hypothetical protein